MEEMDRETTVKVIRDDGDTTRVTTKSGATTLAEVRPTEPPAETWTVIEVDPTGMRKPGECGSYHEAVGRAVDHAMSRQQNG